MKILFAGTDGIAVPTLQRLASMGLVAAVLTNPDAPGKRGKTLVPSPVKAAAVELGLTVLQPEHLGSAARAEVTATGADTLVSFCYGKIFGPKFLSLFEKKFNIHPSLLPKYRGCAPIQNTILNLDAEGGISIQAIAEKVDEGDIYLTQSFALDGTETTKGLEEKVSHLAADLAEDLMENIDLFKSRSQIGEASYTSFIKKEDARIDFSESAKHIHAMIRAYSHWPKAVCKAGDEDLYLLGVSGSVFDIADEECAEAPGTVVAHEKGRGFKIATGSGYLYVNEVQSPTRKAVDSASFLNGHSGFIGTVLC